MFGMGTGGSLRLLSPEISRARLLLPARRGSEVGITLPRFFLLLPHSGSRSAPSKPHRFALPLPPDHGFRFRTSKRLCSCFRFRIRIRLLLIKSFAGRALAPSHLFLPILGSLFDYWIIFGSLDQALDRLVSSSSTHCCASTDDLSTLSSSRGLTCSMQWQFYSPGGLHA